MEPKDRYVGLDLGTSSIKGVLVDEGGHILAAAERPLVLDTPEPLAAEQDPADWWRASCEVLREVVAGNERRVAVLGLTGQKHAFLPLDSAGKPLGKAVLWCDGRAAEEALDAERRVPRRELGKRTGAIALPGTLVPKWLRFIAREPALASVTARLSFAKDYVRLRLTGVFATDRTEASSSLLYDVGRKAWAPELLEAFHVKESMLPQVGRSAEVSARVTAEGASASGIPEGTSVVFGAGDNEAAALGCGATGEGRVAVVLGTSGTVVAHHDAHGAAGGIVWGRHAMRRGYAATGVVLAAGRALEWIRHAAFAGDFTAEQVIAAAEASDPSEGPLVFVPSLAGERSPVPDAGATGAFVGLRPGHGRGHLARAVLEGVALSIAEIVQQLRGAGVPVTELRLTSGGARSPFWRSLVGAACGLTVVPVGGESGPAVGAAMLAARSTGRYGILADLGRAWVAPMPPEVPDPKETERMRGLLGMLSGTRNALRSVGSPPEKRAKREGKRPT